MTSEDIRKKIDDLYANKKARNFFNHLVRAYFPRGKAEQVFAKPVGPFACAITKEPLIATAEIMEGIRTKEFEEDFHTHLKSMFDKDSDVEHPMNKLVGDRKMAVSTSATTTNMAYSTYQEFYNWVVTKMLTGDKHINWLLKDVVRNDLIERASKIDDPEVQEKVKSMNNRRKPTPSKPKKPKHNPATYTLGDISALQELRDKMKD